jgi:S1-C subfamily serine protease
VVCSPLLLLLVSVASVQAAPGAPQKEETTLQKLEREISAIVEKVRPSVVRVHADDLTFSGVIYTKEGHVVTDASGIEHAVELRVSVGERSFVADRVDADRRTGIAVIKISAKELLPASISSEGCKTGAQAIVVGNALGMPSCSSFCTIGGVGRSILVRGRKYENMLQMSAAVLPGDCGAFVADSAGRLVGVVNSAGAVENGDEKLVPAPAFAVPAAWVKFSADRIIKHGKMVRGWLGASLLPLSDAVRSHLGLDAGVGAEVARVERESPARKAGLAARDVLVSFDGQSVSDLDALQWKIAGVEEPTKVRIVFLHNGETKTVETQIELDPQK